MRKMKICGDMKLFALGIFCILLTVALFIWFIWMAEIGVVRTDSASEKRIFQLVCVGLAAAMLTAGWSCLPRWLVRYTFSEDAITISHGFGRRAESYDAKSYCAIDVAADCSLFFGPKDQNAYYLVMSRQRLPIVSITNLGNLRGQKDMVIIRLNKKNRRLLREVLARYPKAPYAPAIRRVLSKVGA